MNQENVVAGGVSQLLGEVLANQRNQSKQMDEIKTDVKEWVRESSIERRTISSSLSDVTQRQEALEKAVAGLKKEIERDVLPVVNQVRDWQKVGVGVVAATGIAATLLTGVASFIVLRWEKIVAFFR